MVNLETLSFNYSKCRNSKTKQSKKEKDKGSCLTRTKMSGLRRNHLRILIIFPETLQDTLSIEEIKVLPINKTPDLDSFTDELYQTFKEDIRASLRILL